MDYPPLEDLLPKAGNSLYSLVRMAAKRAVELAEGSAKLVDVPSTEKTTTVALKEIQAGKVVLKTVADKFKPKEEDKKKDAKSASKKKAKEEA